MKRQDKQGVRTPADIERKYNLGAEYEYTPQNFSKLSKQVAQLSAMLSQFISSTNAALADLRADIENLRADIDKNFKKFHPEAFVFAITNNLVNCVTSNDAVEIVGGEAYTAVISGVDGAVITSLVVLMGGEDITDSVCIYSDSSTAHISITSVTGDVVITAEGGEA